MAGGHRAAVHPPVSCVSAARRKILRSEDFGSVTRTLQPSRSRTSILCGTTDCQLLPGQMTLEASKTHICIETTDSPIAILSHAKHASMGTRLCELQATVLRCWRVLSKSSRSHSGNLILVLSTRLTRWSQRHGLLCTHWRLPDCAVSKILVKI